MTEWYSQRIDCDDGEIRYEAHGPKESFVIFEGPNAKAVCELFLKAVRPKQHEAPPLPDAVDIDALCLMHVNDARAQHEMSPLASLLKASGTELLWGCRRLAKAALAAIPQAPKEVV